MSLIFKILKYVFFFIIVISVTLFLFFRTYYQFGGTPDKKSQLNINNSDHYIKDGFVNIYKIPKFKIDKKLMSYEKKDCIFLHCLPRGKEVTDDIFLGKKSHAVSYTHLTLPTKA